MTAADPGTARRPLALTGGPPRERSERVWELLAGGAVAAVLLLAFGIGRPLWFYADDWNALDKYADGSLLDPFNGHLSLVPAVIFRSMYHLVGVGSYTPYRVLGLVALAGFAVLLFRYVRTRAAGAAAFLVVAWVLWNSAGASNLLFPFLVNFTVPMAALVAIWWHLDREDPRHDLAASAWLLVAMACSGLGVVAMVAVAVELLVGRARLRRWVTMAPGPVLWFVWYVANRDAGEVSTDLPEVARYAWEMLLGATTSLAAGWRPGGVLLLVAGVVALVLLLVRARRVEPRVAAALSAPAAFVVLTSVSRVETFPPIPPDELRYAWTVSTYLLLVAVALWPPRPRPGADAWQAAEHTERADEAERADDTAGGGASTPPRPRWGWISGVAFGVTLALIVAGAVQLHRGMRRWTDMATGSSPGIRTSLYVTEALGRGRVDADRILPLSFVPVTSSDYLGVVDAVGSPVEGVRADELGGDEAMRRVADERLVENLPVSVTPAGVEDRCNGRSLTGEPIPPGTRVGLEVEPGPARGVRIARFSTERGFDLGPLAPGGYALEIPDDRGPDGAERVPYRLETDDGVVVRRCD